VDHDLVMIRTQKDTVIETGGAAVGEVLDVVHLAGRGGLMAAAGPAAAPVAQDDRVADARRDSLAEPDVQGQARPGQPGTQLPGPQERREAAGTGQQVHGLSDNRLFW
jgi:hypothetical protein